MAHGSVVRDWCVSRFPVWFRILHHRQGPDPQCCLAHSNRSVDDEINYRDHSARES